MNKMVSFFLFGVVVGFLLFFLGISIYYCIRLRRRVKELRKNVVRLAMDRVFIVPKHNEVVGDSVLTDESDFFHFAKLLTMCFARDGAFVTVHLADMPGCVRVVLGEFSSAEKSVLCECTILDKQGNVISSQTISSYRKKYEELVPKVYDFILSKLGDLY